MAEPTRTLVNGVKIPVLGLGVYQSEPGDETRTAVLDALELGYRHVDTAAFYENEEDVGEAIRRSKVPREEVFVTTKLWNGDHGYDPALRALDKSLARLGMEYVDLYLIHWPVEGKRKDSWRALEAAHLDGKAKAIGVSNYTVRHLVELTGQCKVPPMVNQVELSPFLQQRSLVESCRQLKIEVEAYSPLTKGTKLKDKTVVAVAKKHGRTAAQVMLRWGVQKDLIVLPKSVRKARIAENEKLFDFHLPPEDVAALDGLEANYRTAWDPTGVP